MSAGAATTDAFAARQIASYVAGETWPDPPECACPVIAVFLRAWSSALPDADRTRILSPLIPRLVGTRSTRAVEMIRSYMALDWLVRVHAPAFLDLVESCWPHAAALRDLAPIVDVGTAHAASDVVRAAIAAARDAAWDARDAAWDPTDTWDDGGAVRAAKAARNAWASWAVNATAGDAAGDAARVDAWDAWDTWDAWDAGSVENATGAAARAAARVSFAPVVTALQASALDLIDHMIAVRDVADAR